MMSIEFRKCVSCNTIFKAIVGSQQIRCSKKCPWLIEQGYAKPTRIKQKIQKTKKTRKHHHAEYCPHSKELTETLPSALMRLKYKCPGCLRDFSNIPMFISKMCFQKCHYHSKWCRKRYRTHCFWACKECNFRQRDKCGYYENGQLNRLCLPVSINPLVKP